MKKKVVIVGFPGIGLSTLADRQKEYIEINPLDVNVVDGVTAALDDGLKVLVPYSVEACDALYAADIKFVIVYPSRDIKERYVSRIVPRGVSDTRIYDISNSWEDMIYNVTIQKCYTRVLLTKPDSYLSDLVTFVENLFVSGK